MGSVSLESLLDFVPEELGGGDGELLALLAVDAEEFFGGVVVVLDLFFGAHLLLNKL